jgi:hypothetical protein
MCVTCVEAALASAQEADLLEDNGCTGRMHQRSPHVNQFFAFDHLEIEQQMERRGGEEAKMGAQGRYGDDDAVQDGKGGR